MTAKTHLLGGAFLSTVTVLVLGAIKGIDASSVINDIPFITGGLLGALLPDIDHPDSRISRRMPLLSFLFSMNKDIKKRKAQRLFLSKDEREKAENELLDASHRGSTHHLLPWAVDLMIGGILMALSCYLESSCGSIFSIFLLGIGIGAISHILLDMISGTVPIFAPLVRKSYGIRLFKTNGLLEILCVRLILAFGTVLAILKIMNMIA